MDELSSCAGGPDSDCTDQFVLTTTGLQVVVLNRARDIVVKITIDLPLENLTWEGRNNRVLLSWDDIRVFKQNADEGLQFDCSSFIFGREVLLPCEVDFSNAVWVLNANHLILRLPKYVQELVQGPAILFARYYLNDEFWVAGEVPGQLAEDRE